MRNGKPNQISFRVQNGEADEIGRAARDEDLAIADFVRKIFRWGFEQYKTTGSLFDLRHVSVKAQVARERKVFEARSGAPKPKVARARPA